MEITIDTPAGMYRTTREHKLAKPDKRLARGWRSQEGIAAGTWVRVRNRPEYAFAGDETREDWRRISFALPGAHGDVDVDVQVHRSGRVVWPSDSRDDGFLAAIVADLEPTRADEAVLAWIDPDRMRDWDAALAVLVHAGRVSEADLRSALRVCEDKTMRDWTETAFRRGTQADSEEDARVGALAYFGRQELDCAEAAAAGFTHGRGLSGLALREKAAAWCAERWPAVERFAPIASDTHKWLAAERELGELRARVARLEQRIGAAQAVLSGQDATKAVDELVERQQRAARWRWRT